ncbi:hypothetical protein [Streptomyces mobaraensis]|uniref:hypothetical protein n=1 Tax=Streptomyces mobaraensis TaxID=35621 RepID=UPI0012AC9FEF|nr:hypothetical protein [Streptomyces mobaraensis]
MTSADTVRTQPDTKPCCGSRIGHYPGCYTRRPAELRACAAELEERARPLVAGPRTDDERMWVEKAAALRAEADRAADAEPRTPADMSTETHLRDQLAAAQARIDVLKRVAQRNKRHVQEITSLLVQQSTAVTAALVECDAMEQALTAGVVSSARLRERVSRIRAVLDTAGD